MTSIAAKFSSFLLLMRFDRPIGTLLLLWPTLGALYLAAAGQPPTDLILVFAAGTFLMRSAGCILNDLADRKLDGAVARTHERPLVTGAVSVAEAIVLAVILCAAALALVLLFTNPLTLHLSFGGLALAVCYPFMKRYTHLPQLVLGAAFSWGIPMAFAAVVGVLPPELWLFFGANVLWTVVYDTEYAMVDRDDDLKIGIKSTAILFGSADRFIIAILQVLTLAALTLAGMGFRMGGVYYLGLVIAAALFIRHQWLIRDRSPEGCFKAFLGNNDVGMAVFASIALDYVIAI